MEEPPPFQAAAQCVACQSPFTTFKRRHHCRACGRSFCNEHSANHKALPQYGLYTPARVCDECFNPRKRSGPTEKVTRTVVVESDTSEFAKLNLGADDHVSSPEDNSAQSRAEESFECTCGMPLCICAPPISEAAPVTTSAVPLPLSARVQQKSPQKSTERRKPSGPSPFNQSTSGSMPSLFFSSQRTSQGSSHPLAKSYDLNGEGIREAVKNGDISAVKELLAQGVDVNYVDKQGMSLVHLAAMFNFTEIAFTLMDSGADLNAKNAQGETALDCAPTTLAHKLRDRIKSDSLK